MTTGSRDDEVVASAVLLLNAGHEASVNVFGNGLVGLLDQPDRGGSLVDGEVDVPVVVEEMLRYDSALQLFERTATADVEVADVVVSRRGEGGRAARSRQPGPGGVRRARPVRPCVASRTRTSRSAPDCTSVSARRWPGWSWPRRSALLAEAYPTLALAGRPRRRPTFVLRGYASVPVIGDACEHEPWLRRTTPST